jgi:fibronectin-binding autotransporter adhesin
VAAAYTIYPGGIPDVIFNNNGSNPNAAGGTVTVSANESVNSLTISGAHWTFSGTGILTIGAGGLAISATPPNGVSYVNNSGTVTTSTGLTGIVASLGGTTTINNAIILGATQAWTADSGNSTNSVTLAGNVTGPTGGGTLTLTNNVNGSGFTLSNIVANGTGGPLNISVANLNPNLAITTMGLTGTANTYTGSTSVQAGTLVVNSLANAGASSSIGAGTGANAIINLGSGSTAGTLVYTGTTASSSNRAFNLGGIGGGILNNTLTTADNLTLSGNVTTSMSGAGTLTLGGTTAAGATTNILSGNISDSNAGGGNTGTLSLANSGTSNWNLSGTVNIAGAIAINSGTYTFSSNDTFGNITAGINGSNQGNIILNGTETSSVGSQSYTVSGGLLTLTGQNNGVSTVSVTSGGTLTMGASATLGSAAITLNGGFLLMGSANNVTASNTLTINSGSGIGVTYTPTTFPTATITGTGVYGLGYTGTGGIVAADGVSAGVAGIDQLFANGWSLGSFTGANGTYTGQVLPADSGGTYHLGGGGGTLTLQNAVLTVAADNLSIGGTSGGTVVIPAGETYGGTTTLVNGTASIASASSFGTATSAINVGSGALAVGINYSGTGENFTRALNFIGSGAQVTLSNSGSGNINYTGADTFSGSNNIFLGNATDTQGGSIGPITGSGTSVTKKGKTGSLWIITGGAGNTYAGNTTINGGVLQTTNVTDLANSSVINITGNYTGLTSDGAANTQAVWQTQGSITRTLGLSAGDLNIGTNGGFAAYGGPLTLNFSGGATLVWGAGGFSGIGGAPLVFGSSTANNVVTLTNNINLNTTDSFNQVIAVEQGKGGDMAVLSGLLTNGAGTAAASGLEKEGPGTLELTNANSTFSGQVALDSGTLIAGGNSPAAGIATTGVFGSGYGPSAGSSAVNNAILIGFNNTINYAPGAANPTFLIGGAYTIGRALLVSNDGTHNVYTIGGGTDAVSTISGLITFTTSPVSGNSFQVTQVATTGSDALNITGGISGYGGMSFNNVGAVNVNSAITGTMTLTQSGTGTTNLSGVNTYVGATTVLNGTLAVNGSLGSSSAVTIGGATASNTPTLTGTGTISGSVAIASAGGGAAGLINPGGIGTTGTLTVGSITFQTGSSFALDLNGASTDLLKINGAATINSGADISINATGLTQTNYVLATAASGLNANPFTVMGSLPTGYELVASATSLDLEALADQTLTAPTPLTINIITGSTTTVNVTLNNTAASGSASLAVNLANNGGTGGVVSSLSAASGTTVAANSSTTVTGTLTAGTVGTGETWSVQNTDPNASPTNVSTGATVNVYNHSAPTLTIATGNNQSVFVNGSLPSTTLTLSDTAGNTPAPLDVSTLNNLTGATGSGVVASGGTGTYTTTGPSTTTAGVGRTQTVSLNTGDQQTVTGANALGTLGQTITYNVYNHAAPTLAISTGNNQSGIAGSTLANATFTLANTTGNTPAPLDVNTLSNLTGATGSGVVATGGTGTYTSTALNTTTVGTGQTLAVSLNAGDQQTIPGANPLTTLTGSVTYNVYNHSTPTLTIATGNNQSGIVGSTLSHATLTLADTTGTTPAPLDVNTLSNLTGMTLVVGLNAGDQQTITGASALGTLSQPVTYNVYNHSAPTLTIAMGNGQSVFVNGSFSPTTLTLSDTAGNTPAPLDVSTLGNLTGATGSGVVASGGTGTYTVTGLDSSSAGIGKTVAASLDAGDQQTITGANPLGALGQTITYNVYNHSAPTLAIATGNNQSGIVGSTLSNATFTLANTAGNTPAPLDVNTLGNLTGSGAVASGGTGTYTSTALDTSTVGTGQTLVVSLDAGDQQSIPGANPLTALTGSVTYNIYNHSAPTLTIAMGNNQSVFVNGTLSSTTLTLADTAGNTPAPLDVATLSTLTGTTGSGVIGSGGMGTYTVTGFDTGSAGVGKTVVVSLDTGDQQTITGANPLAALSQTITYNVYSQATPTLMIATGNNQSGIVGSSLADATLTLANSTGTSPAPLDVNTLNNLTGVTGSGVIASGGTGTYTTTTLNTTTAGVGQTLAVSLDAGGQQTIPGANPLATLGQTITYNVYNHSTPTLTIATGNNQSGIVGSTLANATFTLADTTGTTPAPLDVNGLSNLTGMSGPGVIGSGGLGTYTSTALNTSTVGVGQSLVVSLNAGDAQTVTGANPLSDLNQTVSYNVYNHSTPTLTIAMGNGQSVFVNGTLSTTTLTLADTTGNTPAPLDVAALSNLTGTTGSGIIGSGGTGTYTVKNFNTTTAGIGKTVVASLDTGDQQTVAGANALAALGQTITYNVYNHAAPTLAIATGNNQSGIVGSTLSDATLTLANTSGNTPAPLDVGTLNNLTGTTGSGVIASGGTGTYTTTALNTSTAGVGQTLAVNLKAGDQQTIPGANPLATLGQTITYNVYNHSAPTLAIATGNNQSGIVGSTLANATFTLANTAGNTPAPLDVNTLSNLTGLVGSGVVASGGTRTYTSTALNTSTVGVGQTQAVSLDAGDQQTVAGANPLSALGQTLTYNIYNHAAPTLTIASGNNQSIFVNGSLSAATLTLADTAGTTPAPLDVAALTNLTGATGSGVIGSGGTGTYTVTGFNISSAGIGKTVAASLDAGDQQTITGANPLSALSQTITYNVFNHATSNLISGTLPLGPVHNGYAAPIMSTANLPVTNGSITDDRVDLQGSAAPIGNISLNSLSGIVSGGSGTISATLATGQGLGMINTPFTYTFADQSALAGALSNVGTATITVTGQVYSGLSTWVGNGTGNGSWGTLATSFGTNWGTNQGSPGLDAGFTSTDTATFGDIGGLASQLVTLDGANPSLNQITFDATTTGYNIAPGSGGGIILNGGAGPATITDSATGGTQAISAPVDLATNANVNVASGQQLMLTGAVSGNGGITKTGTGTTILSHANTYAGGTTINAGTVEVAADNNLGTGNITMGGGKLLTESNFTTSKSVTLNNGTQAISAINPSMAIYNGAIGGVGALSVGDATNNGTVVLTGNNTYQGGSTITSSMLAVGNMNALGTGPVTNNGTLTTFGSQHEIQVLSNYTQGANGMLVLNLDSNPVPGNTNDVLTVTGTAALNGTLTLNFIPSASFVPTKGQIFEVVDANGGITALSPGFTAPTVSNVNSGIKVTTQESISHDMFFVTLTSTQLSLISVLGPYTTPNRVSTGTYIDTYISSGPLYGAFVGILNDPANVASALDQLGDEKYANFIRTNTFNNANFFTQEIDSYLASLRSQQGDFLAGNGAIDSSSFTATDPGIDPSLAQIHSQLLAWNPAPFGHGLLSDSTPPVLGGIDTKEVEPTISTEALPWNVFVTGSAILAQDFSQGELPHADATTGTGAVGLNYRVTPHFRVGALFGYGHTNANLDTNNSTATVDSFSPGIFLSYADSGWYGNALATYGFDDSSQDRHVSFGDIAGIAHSDPTGNQIVGDLDGGYDFHIKGLTFGPTLGMQYTYLNVNPYSETGAPVIDLSVGREDTDSLRSHLGGHASYPFQTGKIVMTPHIDAGWQHEFLDQSRGITSQFNSVGAGSFTLTTPSPSRDSALIDCGVDADLSGYLAVFADYLAQMGQSNYFGQSVQVGVKIGF